MASGTSARGIVSLSGLRSGFSRRRPQHFRTRPTRWPVGSHRLAVDGMDPAVCNLLTIREQLFGTSTNTAALLRLVGRLSRVAFDSVAVSPPFSPLVSPGVVELRAGIAANGSICPDSVNS